MLNAVEEPWLSETLNPGWAATIWPETVDVPTEYLFAKPFELSELLESV